MTLALTTGWFPPDTPLADAARQTRALGLGVLSPVVPGLGPGAREDLRAVGVTAGWVVVGEGGGASNAEADAFAQAVERAAHVAVRLKAPGVACEGGGLDARLDRRLRREDRTLSSAVLAGDAPGAEEVVDLRAEARVAAAERAVRALHAPLGAGVPLVIRNGGSAACLLGIEEVEWLLDELPRLGLFFDPARALRLERLGLAAGPDAWAERFARRIRAVAVHGLGRELSGGAHPEDEAPIWRELDEGLPRSVSWVLDLAPSLATADVEDAVRYLEAELAPRR